MADSAYDLDGQHWTAHAACRHTPDAFLAPDGPGRWGCSAALHVCREHCPVLAQCLDYATEQGPGRRQSMILGGIQYDSTGAPARSAPNPSCARCATVVARQMTAVERRRRQWREAKQRARAAA